jgi:hypothetical protein
MNEQTKFRGGGPYRGPDLDGAADAPAPPRERVVLWWVGACLAVAGLDLSECLIKTSARSFSYAVVLTMALLIGAGQSLWSKWRARRNARLLIQWEQRLGPTAKPNTRA